MYNILYLKDFAIQKVFEMEENILNNIEDSNEEAVVNETQPKKVKFKLKDIPEYVPVWSFVIFGLTIASVVLYLIYTKNPQFADFLNDTIGRAIRFVLAQVTSIIPFSLTETVILTSPVLMFLAIFILFKVYDKGKKKYYRTGVIYMTVACIVITTFLLGFQPSFYNPTIDKKLGFDRQKVSAEQLYETGLILLNNCEAELDSVTFPKGTYSSMMMTYDELNEEMNKSWQKVNELYPSFQKMNTRLKPVMFSFLWTYTHISGMYSAISGEANINVNYPDYIIVSSCAHEMAHQRGIGREDEANFVAFLVCSNSDNPYVRYAGYLDAFVEVANSLYSADKDLYSKLMRQKDDRITEEQVAYSKFFDKYRTNTAAKVSDAVNNTTIKMHGQSTGVKSYGLVVDLLVAYYAPKV